MRVQYRILGSRRSGKPLPNKCGAAVGCRVVIYCVISITSHDIRVLCYRCFIQAQVFNYWLNTVTRDFFICVLFYRCSIEPQVFKYWLTRDFFICVLCYRCSIQPQVFKYCEICPKCLNIHEIFLFASSAIDVPDNLKYSNTVKFALNA